MIELYVFPLLTQTLTIPQAKMKANLQFLPMWFLSLAGCDNSCIESLKSWWEQMINLWGAIWLESRKPNYMVRAVNCGAQVCRSPCFWLYPYHNSSPHFVRTLVVDALLIPLHPNQSSPAAEDIGFGPKVNNSLIHLNSENICLMRLLWKHCQIFHIALFAHHHNPLSTHPQDYSHFSGDLRKNRSVACSEELT